MSMPCVYTSQARQGCSRAREGQTAYACVVGFHAVPILEQQGQPTLPCCLAKLGVGILRPQDRASRKNGLPALVVFGASGCCGLSVGEPVSGAGDAAQICHGSFHHTGVARSSVSWTRSFSLHAVGLNAEVDHRLSLAMPLPYRRTVARESIGQRVDP